MQPTHAGAVAFRDTPRGREYLVQSSSTGSDWVLPKGHIERGETIEETALRELLEEAAIRGQIVGRVGEASFSLGTGPAVVAFVLVQANGTTVPMESRIVQWLPYDTARKTLTFREQRAMLDEAERMFRESK